MTDTPRIESLAFKLMYGNRPQMHMDEAAEMLYALATERDELRAALEPFATHNSSEPTITITVKTEDVTRARAALARSGS